MMWAVDRRLSDEKIMWRRFVDDFVLIAASQADAYRALAVLSNALADYGLTLNRTKTTILTAKHYTDYVNVQLRGNGEAADKLLEIDLHFDPYTDNPEKDYEELKEIIGGLDVRVLLDLELHKAQPDPFVVSQIGRTLKLHEPEAAAGLCRTLLSKTNLHAFRASWSTIMRGISSVRADSSFASIFVELDELLDAVSVHSKHLLQAETSCLHYLRSIRFARTQQRAEYLSALYSLTSSEVVRRACIDCWRQWKDRASFTRERNRWNTLSAEAQRMLWAAAPEFGDEGLKFRAQVKRSLENSWKLGIERQGRASFLSTYLGWSDNAL
jgi:hypothetical protein